MWYNVFMEKMQEGQVVDERSRAGKVIVSWEGEEYVIREKNAGWYVGLTVVTVVLVIISILLRWWTFTAVVILAVVALVLYTVRPPRKIKYVLSGRGMKEGERMYLYADFRAFGVEMEEGHYAIVLIPRKRFSPRVRVYFPKEMGEAIVDAFGARLPMEEVRYDILDKMVRWLRI